MKMDVAKRIAMWSGPRNLSTALMYAFAARGDCAVWDEPFYAAYLAATGIDHPLRDEVLKAGLQEPTDVAEKCLGPVPEGTSFFYQKHMTQHMVPSFDRSFLNGLTNVFLIRHPARVVASYARKREKPDLADLGFVQQAEMFDAVCENLGAAPLVIDAVTIEDDPAAALRALCDGLGMAYTDKMLHWPTGPKPYDGVWAPHWYSAVHASTGFLGAENRFPDLAPTEQKLADAALPFYLRLSAFSLGKPPNVPAV